MVKWMAALLVATACGVVGSYALLAQPKAEPTTAELMKKKLEYGQKLLSALTLNELDTVASEAEHLIQVRKEAAFRAIKTPEYEMFADDFEHAARAMKKAAKEKNIESAKLHYLGMTMACFNCHAYVRDVRKGG